jgi:hypothetical protein
MGMAAFGNRTFGGDPVRAGSGRVLLKAEGLVKVYGSGGERHPAVRNVNLACREGDFTVIMTAEEA